MNREQRRAQFKKQPRKAKELASRMADKILEWHNGLQPRTKVKLDLKRMMNSTEWGKKTDAYRLFCMAHAKDVMTVQHDKVTLRRPDLVVLAEDVTSPKWLFHVSDLIVQEATV